MLKDHFRLIRAQLLPLTLMKYVALFWTPGMALFNVTMKTWNPFPNVRSHVGIKLIFNMLSLPLLVVREITDMKIGNYHLKIKSGNKLVMSSSPDSYWHATLRLYSNKQMWAVSKRLYQIPSAGSFRAWTKCVRIAGGNREQLQQLDGLKLELKFNEQGKYLYLYKCAISTM